MFVSEIRCLDTGVLHVVTHASESVSPPVVGMRFGYTRVSTVAQTFHQKHDALKAAGASKIYSDTMSGARDDCPGLAALMDQLRAGNTVVVWRLDRLGRNMLHILETVKGPDRGGRDPGVDCRWPNDDRCPRVSRGVGTRTHQRNARP
jgi:hypothetical protein